MNGMLCKAARDHKCAIRVTEGEFILRGILFLYILFVIFVEFTLKSKKQVGFNICVFVDEVVGKIGERDNVFGNLSDVEPLIYNF